MSAQLHPATDDGLVDSICAILRRYAFDANEALDADNLIFEADYANQILELPALTDILNARDAEALEEAADSWMPGQQDARPWVWLRNRAATLRSADREPQPNTPATFTESLENKQEEK